MPEAWQKQQKSASVVIDGPRSKSDPPKPPMGAAMINATDEVIDNWGKELKTWQEENKHLPNIQPVDRIVQSLKQRRDQMKNQQAGGALGTQQANMNPQINTLTTKVQSLEVKMDKLMNHLGIG